MNKNILLGTLHNFSSRVNLWGFSIAGFWFLANGIIHLHSDIAHPIGLIIGVIMVPCGIGYAVYGILSFSESSKYAPRFTLNEKELLFKEKLSKPAISFLWDHIKKIEIGSYRLDISTEDSDKTLSYLTNPNTSKRIKSAIREIAESKNIEVIG